MSSGVDHDRPWYGDGLRFECTRCGKCCTGKTGHVWVDESEIRALANVLSLSLDELGTRFLRKIGTRYSLLENGVTGDCVFLRDGLCDVHAARPRQCRSFPFWSANLASKAAWNAAALECEGINDDAPVVDAADVSRLAALHERG